MSRGKRIALSVAAALGIVVVLVVGAVLIITQTDWGREQVRRVVLDQLEGSIDGELSIGRIEGNLLRGLRLVDVSLVDAQGRPFIQADTISTRFSLRSLARQRIILTDLRLVRAIIVLDKPPGEDWNWVRIFPTDPEPEVIEPERPGFGDWLEMHNVTLVDSRITVRTEWQPPEDLTPAESEKALRLALSGETRENVVEVPGGYQNVMDFRELNAEMPWIRIAHPDSTAIPVEIARFSGIVQPFRPPYAVVNDLAGSFRLAKDTLFFNGVQAALPGSRLAADGAYALDAGDLVLRMHGSPVAFADLRWLYPPLPEEGGGMLRLALNMRSLTTHVVIEDMDLRVGEGTLAGRVDLMLGDTVRLQNTDVRFAQLDTRLVQRMAPELELPRHGTLTGRVALTGHPEAMQVDGDVTFADYRAGTSRVRAAGQVGIDEEIRFRDLRLRFEPLQAELVRAFVPQLPLRGTIAGYANLTGVATGPLQLDSDLTLRDPRAGVSRVRATGGVDTRDELRLQNLLVRFDPLRLDLVRHELPELPAGGTIAGQVRLHGVPQRQLEVDGDLTLRDPRTGVSRVAARGGIAVADGVRFRDLRLRLEPLQVDFVRPWAPDLPAGATLAGPLRLNGSPTGLLQLDGDLTLRDPATGVSRVAARGALDFRDELAFRGLTVRADPLQIDLVRRWVPELPLDLAPGATLQGQALLDGDPQRRLQVDGDLTLRDPATGVSRVAAAGGIRTADELRFDDLRLRFQPMQLDLLRPQVPDLPAGVTVAGPLRLNGSPTGLLQLDGDLTLADPRTGVSQVAVSGGLLLQDDLAFRDFRIRADPLRLDLVRPWLPDLPAGATVEGRASLDGSPAGMMQVDADLAVRDPRTGLSRIAAQGGIAVGDQVRFRNLDLRFQPLRLELARAFAPDLPLGGALAGTARLNGSPDSQLGFRANLVHQQAGERSHVVGQGDVVMGPQGRANVDLQLQPLSLVTVGRFAPEAGLRGSVSGNLQASGNLSDLALRTDLRFQDGGTLAGQGTLDLASDDPAYNLDLRLGGFNLAAVSTRAPARTDLTGTASARGRGFDPTTMRATLAADLVGSAVDGVAADEVRLRVGIANALAQFDSSVIRVGTAEAMLNGSFGLAAGRYGELAYRVSVDSLHAFARWIPGADTAVTPPPRLVDTQLALQRAVEVGAVDDTVAVERVEQPGPLERSGRTVLVSYPGSEERQGPEPALVDPAPLAPRPDTVAADTPTIPRVPADSLAGRLFAEGRLRGNIERFDADGLLEVDDLVYGGNEVGTGRARFDLARVGTPEMGGSLNADFRAVRAAGMEFDSATVRGQYSGGRFGTGQATVAVFQDEDMDLRVDAAFSLSLERNELRLSDLAMRFDTVTWQTTQPGLVSWGGAGVEVESLELRSDQGGRIFVDGRLPIDGAANLDVVIEDFEIGHVVALLQNESDAAGLLSLRARVEGTQRAPRFEGDLQLVRAVYNERRLPDARADFAYANQELTANAELLQEGQVLAVAEAQLPIDLALTGVEQRMLNRPMAVDVRADDLRLDPFAGFTDAVDDLRGRIVGNIAARGTFEDPELSGLINLDIGSFGLVPLGIRFEEIAGTVRLQNDVLTVDSLVAWSGGPVRVTGDISLEDLASPVFNLDVTARETWVIDTDDARLMVNADLAIAGPLDGIRVTGDVRTRRGVIYIPELSDFGGGQVVNLEDPGTFARVDTLFAAERELMEPGSPLLENMRLDLALQVDRDVWLRSTEANVEIYTPEEVGPLRVSMNGGPGALSLEGTINTDRGEYEFMGRRFRLTRGGVTFTGGPELNPILQLAAEHEVRLPGREAFEIRVVISGTLEDLTIALESSSQPPISQTDLMSYLAFGRDASSLLPVQGSGLSGQGTQSGALVGNVAGLVTQQLAAVAMEAFVKELESDAARSLGLDVIRITPADLPAEVFTGNYLDVLRGTEVEAGRYINERLFVAGQARAARVPPGIRVEYRTPQGLQWVVSWQPRFLPSEPSLDQREPQTASVLGSFLFREWRF
jgi:translocation and assembly module TamB